MARERREIRAFQFAAERGFRFIDGGALPGYGKHLGGSIALFAFGSDERAFVRVLNVLVDGHGSRSHRSPRVRSSSREMSISAQVVSCLFERPSASMPRSSRRLRSAAFDGART